MEKAYKPIERIVVQKDVPDPVRKVVKGRPDISNITDRLEKLSTMLQIKYCSDPISLIDACIEQLEKVPYIPYPISFSTVDMVGVTYKMVNGVRKPFILLGRRSEKHLWQFPGGFRDPKERNIEAAHREYIEETSLDIPISRFKFLDDMFVDDRRYRDTPHKITTHIFLVKVLAKEAKKALAADDIFEVKWFDLDYLRANRDEVVRDVHTNLFNLVEQYL